MLKKIIEYWPLVTITLTYFGFCNLYFYYSEFNIHIYSYISVTDILLSFFPKIAIGSTLFYSFCMGLIIDSPGKTKYKSDGETSDQFNARMQSTRNWWGRYWWTVLICYYGLAIIVNLILTKCLHFKAYNFIELNILFDIVLLTLIAIGVGLNKRVLPLIDLKLLAALFFVFFIGNRITSYAKLDAQKVKDGKSEYKKDHLRFKYGTTLMQTSDSLVSIGETSNYLFLYSIKDSSAMAIPFSKIDSLIIR